jgi:hypothetical protein
MDGETLYELARFELEGTVSFHGISKVSLYCCSQASLFTSTPYHLHSNIFR